MRTLGGLALLGLVVATDARAQGVEESWHLTGRVSATACAGSRCANRHQRIDKTITVVDGQITNLSELGSLCDSAVAIDATALGEYVPARRGWLRFRLTNRRLLRDIMRTCLGNRTAVLTGFGSRVRPSADGQSFVERMHLSLTLFVRGQQVNVTAGGRFRGSRVVALTRWADAVRTVTFGEVVRAALAP